MGNNKPRPQRPAWDRYQDTYLDDLANLGVRPESVDFVICTHLHIDHVGWNTQFIDGQWVPTFPNAQYLFVGDEWEYWRSQHDADAETQAPIGDSVWPVVEAGLVQLIDSDHVLTDTVGRVPSTCG